LGCMMGVIMTAVQNSSRPSEIGMTTSAVNLIRSVGATIGTAVFAMLISNKINGELQSILPPEVYDVVPHSTGILDLFADMPSFIASMLALGQNPEVIAGDILLAFANSVDFAFISGGILILLLVVIGLIFKVEPQPDSEEVDIGNINAEN
ncbi:MAG: hypothetical protein J5494_02845, partial [Candidatus Methanomethylophilaceae archaeon]|nr:hypothetical protein [Candidatus Methanomethylophilaceae archaeon]